MGKQWWQVGTLVPTLLPDILYFASDYPGKDKNSSCLPNAFCPPCSLRHCYECRKYTKMVSFS